MPSKNESTAAVALALVMPVSCAILVMRSCLFIDASGEDRGRKPCCTRLPANFGVMRLYACGAGVSMGSSPRARDRIAIDALRCGLCPHTLECGVEDHVFLRSGRSEFRSRFVDSDIGLDALALDGAAIRTQVACVGEPQSASFG